MVKPSAAFIADSVAGAILCLLAATASSIANAAEIKVLSSLGVKPAMIELMPKFEQSSGHNVTVDYGTVGALAGRIQKGEAADVLIATQQEIANLEKQGRIVAGSSIGITKTGVGVFVRKGAPKPDISSVEAFKGTLLAAKSIGHADPARGGSIAVYVAALLNRLDIAADIKPKIRLFPPSVYDLIATGEVELGFGGISEILVAPGVELVGPLPAEIQNFSVIVAGIVASSTQQHAGKALIQFISSPAAAAAMKARGFEPR